MISLHSDDKDRLWWQTLPPSSSQVAAKELPETSLLSQLTRSDIAELSAWLQEPAFAQYCRDVEDNVSGFMTSHFSA